MKNSILFLVLIFSFQLALSQSTDSLTTQSQKEMYDFYISKHKKQKKAGWILLGSGVVAFGTGVIIGSNSGLYDDGFAAGALLVTAGTLSTISSIPLFIVSGSNNRKAKALLGSGQVGIGTFPYSNARYASVGIKIDF